MKKDDWQKKFEEYVIKQNGMAYEWGKNDCVQFVNELVRIQTGKDFFKRSKVKYRDRKTAMEALREMKGMRKALTGIFGKPVSPLYGDAGDIVMLRKVPTRGWYMDSFEFMYDLKKDKQPTIGIVSLDCQNILAKTEAGDVVMFPLNIGNDCWKLENV